MVRVCVCVCVDRTRSSEVPHFTPASDCYSLGMLMFELVTRTTPFAAMQLHFIPLAVARNQRPAFPPRLSVAEDDAAAWRALIERLWDKEPAMRPSLLEVLAYLVPLRRHSPERAASLSPSSPFAPLAPVYPPPPSASPYPPPLDETRLRLVYPSLTGVSSQ